MQEAVDMGVLWVIRENAYNIVPLPGVVWEAVKGAATSDHSNYLLPNRLLFLLECSAQRINTFPSEAPSLMVSSPVSAIQPPHQLVSTPSLAFRLARPRVF